MSKTEEFVNKSINVHGDKYDYSMVEYINNKSKVKIICNKHGMFEQKPINHYVQKHGCPKCSGTGKLTTQDFISKSIKIHGDKYDYSMVEYINNITKVQILCKKHGSFEQAPNNHLMGQDCPTCGFKVRDDKLRYTKDDFIKKSKNIHSTKYDYSLVVYTGSKNKVEIICKEHGIFLQNPIQHMRGAGCNKCAIYKNTFASNQKTKNNLIDRFIKIHGNKYDYSGVEYKDAESKVRIICPKHGDFHQKPHNHLTGQCCPKCSTSKGINLICKFLDEKNIHYVTEHKFEGCVSDKNYYLKFDIFIQEMNLCIEYDGEQHFRPVEIWGGMDSYIKLKNRDSIKDEYCKKNNINLCRISYRDNIEDKLLGWF